MAYAQDEYSLILFDRTGSMSEMTSPTSSRWMDAMDAAKNLVSSDRTDTAANGTPRAYSIWDFRVLGPQTTAEQVWPMAATDCPTGSTFVALPVAGSGTNNYCRFDGTSLAPYNSLISRLEAYKTDPDRVPDGNRFGRTSLAHSLCRSLDQLSRTIAGGGSKQTITLESDGLENESPPTSPTSVCGNYLDASTNTNFVGNNSFTFNKAVDDWDLSGRGGASGTNQLPAGSWEARIVRRGLRLNNIDPGSAVTNLVIPPNTTASTNLAWRIDVHYRICPSGASPCQGDSLVTASTTAPLASSASSVATTDALDTPRSSASDTKLASAGVFGATGTRTASTPTTSLPLSGVNYFRNLASPNFPSRNGGASRAKFRAITYTEGQVFGRNHAIPGDVDDSGCTDRADLSIVMQKDVYYQRAVRPCEICERADLNRDGWVNEADRAIVINNWGAHTTQPCRPGPRPAL